MIEPIIVSVSNINQFGFVIHGENLAEQFGFDFTEWVEAYGAGTISMRLRRNGDANPYPVILTTEGNIAIWSPTETDTARSGLAKAQLIYTAGETIAKTLVFGVRVAPSLGPTTDPPEPFEDWLDQLTDLAAETQQNAEDAAQSATDANEAKGEAIQAKNDAVTAKGEAEEAKRNAVTAQGKAEEAQHNAEEAVAHYPKIVNGYWYVWQNDGWVNTGVKAEGSDGRGITSITSVKSSTVGLVDTYTVTVTYDDNNTDTYTFTVTNGRDGTDGITPTVTVTTITGGHNVAFDYGTGDPRNTDFDVMDGEVSTADLTAVANSKAPVITDTASGSIASFPDGSDDMPMKQIVGEIVPQQDLHGQSNPYPAGGGKNLANPLVTVGLNISSSGAEETGTAASTSDYIKVNAGTTYVFYVKQNVDGVRIAEYDANKSFILRIPTEVRKITFTANASTAYVRFSINYNSRAMECTQEVVNSLNPMLETAPETSYAPYSNICPITGWTGANVYDDPAYGGTIKWNQLVQNGDFATTDNWSKNNGNIEVSNNKLTFTATSKSTYQYVNQSNTAIGNIGHLHKVLMLATVTLSQAEKVGFGDGTSIITTFDMQANVKRTIAYINTWGAGRNAFYIYPARTAGLDVDATMTLENVMLIDLTECFGAGNEPSTVEECKALFYKGYYATDTSYTETTVSAVNNDSYGHLPITWQSSAGTVYGGNFVVNEDGSVTLRAVNSTVTFDGSSDESISDASSANSSRVSIGLPSDTMTWTDGTVTTGKLFSNEFAEKTNSDTYNGGIGIHYRSNGSQSLIVSFGNMIAHDSSFIANVKTWLSNNPLQVLYWLATPIEYTLSDVTMLNTLLGQNNVWTDTGSIECEYRCDTRLYIDKKLAALVAALS